VGRSDLAYQMRVAFMMIYTPIAVWLLVKWFRRVRGMRFTSRDWLGAIAFWFGILSSLIQGCVYLYYSLTQRLIFGSGLGLWYLLMLGLMTALCGLIFGVAGRGWVRRAAVFVSAAMAFQWANLGCPLQYKVLLTELMFVIMIGGTLLWFGIHLWLQRLTLKS
jgi:hypothetical protein